MSGARMYPDPKHPGWWVVQIPYNPILVDTIKRTVPAADRAWDPKRKVWQVRAHHTIHLDAVLAGAEFRAEYTPAPPARTAPAAQDAIRDLFAATPPALRTKVHRALAKALHPDTGGDVEMAKALNVVWQEVAA